MKQYETPSLCITVMNADDIVTSSPTPASWSGTWQYNDNMFGEGF